MSEGHFVYHPLPDDDSDDGIVFMTPWYGGNTSPGVFIGPPPVPDPLYFELKDEVEGMCLVATSWLESLGNHIYTRTMREDIEEFQLKMTMFLTSLEYPGEQAVEVPVGQRARIMTKEEFWGHLKDEYEQLKMLSENIRCAPKRVRRTPSGDEAPNRMNNFLSSQTTGSSSQRAPTSAPPPITTVAEDTDTDHHAQPS
jgi:hypothetical protein